MLKFIRKFGERNSVIIGTLHNTEESLKFIDDFVTMEKFDYFLIELNRDNFSFIRRNQVYFSEFFPVINGFNDNKIVLIDSGLEVLLINYKAHINSQESLFDIYLSYRYNKHYYNTLHNIMKHQNEIKSNPLKSFYAEHPLKKVYIDERESNMLRIIRQYTAYKICVIVGRNHFPFLFNELNKL